MKKITATFLVDEDRLTSVYEELLGETCFRDALNAEFEVMEENGVSVQEWHTSVASAPTKIRENVTVQEWIPVEDRLPSECGMACLLAGVNCFGQHTVFQGFTGYMKNGIFEWHTNLANIDISVWTITHWMPIPQPPKGE